MSKTFVIDEPSKSEIKHIKKDDAKKEENSVAKDKHTENEHQVKQNDVTSTTTNDAGISTHTVAAESSLPDTGVADIMGSVSHTSILIGVALFLVVAMRHVGQSFNFVKQKG